MTTPAISRSLFDTPAPPDATTADAAALSLMQQPLGAARAIKPTASSKEINTYKQEIHRLEAVIARDKHTVTDLEGKVRDQQAQISILEQAKAAANRALVEATGDTQKKGRLEDRNRDLTKEVASLQQALAEKDKEKMEAEQLAERIRTHAQATIEQWKVREADLMRKCDGLTVEGDQQRKKIAELHSANQCAEQANATKAQQNESLQRENEQERARSASFQETIRQYEAENSLLRKNIEDARNKDSLRETELFTASEQHATVTSHAQQLQLALTTMQQSLEEMKQRAEQFATREKAALSEIETKKGDIKKLEFEIEQQKCKVDQANRDTRRVQLECDTTKDQLQQSRAAATKAAEQVRELREKLCAAEGQIADKASEASRTAQAKNAVASELATHLRKMEELAEENDAQKREMEVKKQELASIVEHLRAEQDRAEKAEANVVLLESQAAEREAEHAVCLADAQREADQLKTTVNLLREELSSTASAHQVAGSELNEICGKNRELTARLYAQEDAIKVRDGTIAEQQRDGQQLRISEAKLTAQLFDAKTKVANTQKELDASLARETALKSDLENTKRTVDARTSTIADRDAEIAAARQNVVALKDAGVAAAQRYEAAMAQQQAKCVALEETYAKDVGALKQQNDKLLSTLLSTQQEAACLKEELATTAATVTQVASQLAATREKLESQVHETEAARRDLSLCKGDLGAMLVQLTEEKATLQANLAAAALSIQQREQTLQEQELQAKTAAALLSTQLESVSARERAVAEQLGSAQAALKAYEDEIMQLKGELEMGKKQIVDQEEAMTAVKQSYAAETSALKSEVATLQDELAKVKADINDSGDTIAKLTSASEAKKLQWEFSDKQSQMRIAELQRENVKALAYANDLRREAEEREETIKKLRSSESRLGAVMKELESTAAQLASAQAALQEARSQHTLSVTDSASLKKQLAEVQRAHAVATEQLQKLQQQSSTSDSAAQKSIVEFREEVRRREHIISDLKSQLTIVREQLDAEQKRAVEAKRASDQFHAELRGEIARTKDRLLQETRRHQEYKEAHGIVRAKLERTNQNWDIERSNAEQTIAALTAERDQIIANFRALRDMYEEVAREGTSLSNEHQQRLNNMTADGRTSDRHTTESGAPLSVVPPNTQSLPRGQKRSREENSASLPPKPVQQAK